MVSLRKMVFGLTITMMVLALAGSFFAHNTARAQKSQTISVLSVSVANPAKSATTTYTLSLKSTVDIPKDGGRVHFQFNGPYTNDGLSNTLDFSNATLGSTTSPSSLAVYSRDWNGLTLQTSSTILANTTLTLVVNTVVNPSRGGRYVGHLWTSNYSTDLDGSSSWGGDYTSPYLEIGTNTNVVGTITDASGSPVPFASVQIATANSSSYYYGYTDTNGVYGLADVAAGTYTHSLYYSAGYASGKTYFPPANSTITVAASGVTAKNSSFLSASKTLSGKVTKDTSTGSAGVGVTVSASKMNSNGYASTTADSSGNYSLTLTGGTWTLNIYSNNGNSDWTYDTNNETISFADDSTVQSQTKNFVVATLNSNLTGKITYPDGSALANQYSVGLNVSNTNGKYFSSSLDSTGAFTVKVTAGTYSISGWSSDARYSFPKIDNVTISADETKSIGTIKLVEKTDSISGTVTDSSGTVVAGANISAWKNDSTSDYGNTTSAADGTYTLKTNSGTYSVSVYPKWDSGLVAPSKPASVTVTSGTPAIQNFVLKKATNILNITVTDSDGITQTGINSWVSAGDGSTDWGSIGTSINQGVGTMYLPQGTWTIGMYLSNSDFSSPDTEKVTFDGDGATKSLTLKLVKNTATVKGTIYDDKGNKVTGNWISIYATRGKGGSWQNATVDQTSGTYTLKLAEGTWKLGWWIDQALGFAAGAGDDIELIIQANETKTYDITLKKASATITGKASKANGDAMQWAWISADTRNPNKKTSADMQYFSNGTSSNASGTYTLKVPAGTYFVGGNMWPGSGVLNPKRQEVTVKDNESATVDLTFRTADAAISGTTKKDGKVTSAYVTAWSEDGGYTEANSDNQGSFSLSVSKGAKWHVRALQQVDKDVYKSVEKNVDMTNATSATQDLDLTKQSFTLPNTNSTTFDPTKQQTVALTDGTTVSVPANSMATSGNVTIVAEPTATLPEQPNAKPISYGYNLTANDQTGKDIATFTANVTIEAKYTDTAVKESKVASEDDLTVGYYDKSTATWIPLKTCTKNKNEKTITCQTDHFTSYAILASSDTTPPAEPTDISATAGDGSVTLAWTKPSDGDLSGISIYRSIASGTVGDKVTSENPNTTYKDSGLTNGTTYYYTVKAVDTSGNESTNTTQISSTPGSLQVTTLSGTTTVVSKQLPKTGASTNLLFGMMILLAIGLGLMRLSRGR